MVALASAHPLAQSRSLPVKALEGRTIRMGTAPSATSTVASLCQQAGFEPRFGPQASDVVMATLHVAISSDVTLVPASMINVQIPGVSYVPLDPAVRNATMDLYCYYREAETSPLLAAMLGVVRAFRKDKQLAR